MTSQTQIAILACLQTGPLNAPALQKALSLHRTTVGDLLADLVMNGFVETIIYDEKRGRKNFEITQEGRAELHAAEVRRVRAVINQVPDEKPGPHAVAQPRTHVYLGVPYRPEGWQPVRPGAEQHRQYESRGF